MPKYVWKYARDLFGGLLQVARVSDVVAVQHGAGLMADDIHHHALWDAGADHIPGCRAPQIMEVFARASRALTGKLPRVMEVLNGLPVAVEYPGNDAPLGFLQVRGVVALLANHV